MATRPRMVAAWCYGSQRAPATSCSTRRRGRVTVGAGVSIDELLAVIVPQGFFVPVTPGTRFVTIGGAIASDIHGKNHHVDGSIGNHVESISMMLADGSTAVIGPAPNPALFWATIGGMGLTGVMIDATIRLLPIETSRMRIDTSRVADLDALLATMSCGDDDVRYSVAWIDLVAKGRHLGRSVLTRGDHALVDDLNADAMRSPRLPTGRTSWSRFLRSCHRWACSTTPRLPRSTRPGSAGRRRHASGEIQGIGAVLPSARSGRLVEPPVRQTAAWCSTSSSCRSVRRTRCGRLSSDSRPVVQPAFSLC